MTAARAALSLVRSPWQQEMDEMVAHDEPEMPGLQEDHMIVIITVMIPPMWIVAMMMMMMMMGVGIAAPLDVPLL